MISVISARMIKFCMDDAAGYFSCLRFGFKCNFSRSAALLRELNIDCSTVQYRLKVNPIFFFIKQQVK